MQVLPICSGDMTTLADGSLACSTQWQLLPVDQLLTTFDPLSMDPTVLAAAFGSGFIAVATFQCAGLAAGAVLKSIRKM
ncbi:hypothetical protein H9C73_14015 [Marinobacterium sp. AK62]|uniref:Uncharacterized protein n=1 Tax=Marinobacterium alkalitolerans TaxID=1542925 RepID=A0ABS3ZFM4_9GAMM|nr:hypothetical protein [Marinobacterium alkalitolerans]MBP0049844.1 hypothetical protein [Marinobacterium alkalitolerans]